MSSSLGERLRAARKARGISLRKLAERVGIHYSHLSKVENDKDYISKDSLIRIAEALGVDPDLMLGEAGRKSMPFRVVGDIAAGAPIDAIEDFETFDLANAFDPRDHFLLRVLGNSMIDDGIHDGDLAIIRHTSDASNGDTVVAMVDGVEATLKRFTKQRNNVILTPANKRMKEMTYPATRVEIKGFLVGVVRTSVK